MSENQMYGDLLAAQKEMPALQKTAINPHFKNKFVPLEELIAKIVPVLNSHNIVLVQQPTTIDGQPALRTALIHVSGQPLVDSTMLLMASQEGPQGQGSAITYARRYSLMSVLGLSADQDDDAEATRPQSVKPAPQAPRPANGVDQQIKMLHAIASRLDPEIRDAIFAKHAPAEAFDENGKIHFGRLNIGQKSTLIRELQRAEREGVPMT